MLFHFMNFVLVEKHGIHSRAVDCFLEISRYFVPSIFFVEFELVCHNYIVGTKRSDTQTIKTSEKEMINNEYF